LDTVLTETYRPKNLQEVVGQDNITNILKAFVKTGKIPHMMFVGPPGIGKTTTAIALAKELFGDEWEKSFKEINASDERGIPVVRGQIKTIASMEPLKLGYKIIFLDEADQLTPDAQAALRRTIERASETCRFIFSINYPNKIIEPIADRLVEFRFHPLKPADMKFLLDKVSTAENLNLKHEVIYLIATLSNGSMRRALNVFDTIKMADMKDVTEEKIYEMMFWVDETSIKNLVITCIKGDFGAVNRRIDDILNQKMYAPQEVLQVLYRVVKEAESIPNEAKYDIIEQIGLTDYRLAVKGTPEIQMKTLIAYMMKVFKKYMNKEA